MLLCCSYRHLPGLQQLTSRYLTASPLPSEAKRTTPAESGLEALREIDVVVEAAGFFMVPLCTTVVTTNAVAGVVASSTTTSPTRTTSPSAIDTDTPETSTEAEVVCHRETGIHSGLLEVLTMLLGDVSCQWFSRCLTGPPPIRLAALTCLSQQWKNITQLGSGLQQETDEGAGEAWKATGTSLSSAMPGRHPPLVRRAERFARHMVPAVEWSWYPAASSFSSSSSSRKTTSTSTSPSPPPSISLVPLERYTSSATCHQDPARTARLWYRLVALSTVLDPPPPLPPLPFAASASAVEGAVPTSVATEMHWSLASMKAMKKTQQALLDGLARYYDQRARKFPKTSSSTVGASSSSSSSLLRKNPIQPASTSATRDTFLQMMKVDHAVREDLSAAVRILSSVKRRRCPEAMADANTVPQTPASSPTPRPAWMWTAAEEKTAMQWMEEHHLLEEEEAEKK